MVMPSLHPCERDLDFPTRRLRCLLHEGADHNEPLPLRREIDRARNAIPPSHPDFPELVLKMVDMRLPDLLRTKRFEQLGNTQEVGVHVSWKALELWFSIFGDFDVPAHTIL
jgi:hypothetical protein